MRKPDLECAKKMAEAMGEIEFKAPEFSIRISFEKTEKTVKYWESLDLIDTKETI